MEEDDTVALTPEEIVQNHERIHKNEKERAEARAREARQAEDLQKDPERPQLLAEVKELIRNTTQHMLDIDTQFKLATNFPVEQEVTKVAPLHFWQRRPRTITRVAGVETACWLLAPGSLQDFVTLSLTRHGDVVGLPRRWRNVKGLRFVPLGSLTYSELLDLKGALESLVERSSYPVTT